MGRLGLAFILAILAFTGFLWLSHALDWPRPVQQLALALFVMGIPLSAGAGALLGVKWPWRRPTDGKRGRMPTR